MVSMVLLMGTTLRLLATFWLDVWGADFGNGWYRVGNDAHNVA